jgi:Rrf2 family protein
MKITSKMHCGMVVVIELALYQGENGLKHKELGERLVITPKFLDSILSDLKKAGLIYRKPGFKNGGYKLINEPANISSFSVYRAFEPELNLHHCLIDGSLCQRSTFCGSHYLLEIVNDEMKNKMESVSIKDLIDYQEKALTNKI